jgi:hypothetical protein
MARLMTNFVIPPLTFAHISTVNATKKNCAILPSPISQPSTSQKNRVIPTGAARSLIVSGAVEGPPHLSLLLPLLLFLAVAVAVAVAVAF